MQDHQSLTAAGFPQLKIQFPEHEQLRCPRCDSANTKFCYYNNYNLSQPRHFCKNCRRYWTKGGTLRNIPVGGGCRKTNKRAAPASDSNSSKQLQQQHVVQTPSASSIPSSGSGSVLNYSQPQNPTLKIEPGPILGVVASVGTGSDIGKESFTSLLGLAPNGQFGNFINRPSDGSSQNTGLDVLHGRSGSSSQGFMVHELQNGSDTNCWASNNNNNNGWPDLSINNPGFKLQ